MSVIRKAKNELGRGRVDRAKLAKVTEADIARWKAQDGYADFEFTKEARFVPAVDVRAIREEIGLTQWEFAQRYRLSLRTIQEWEQGRKQPSEAARVLLFAISREPKALAKALR
jgi:putative transcriptional regulator